MPNLISSAASDNSIRLERLEQDRCTLLDVINKAKTSENGDGRGLKALRENYNEIMEMKDSLQHRQLLDPTEVLPPELSAAIFFEASAAAAIDDQYDASSEDLLLLLTLVSKRWCEIILGTPWLWTRITVVRSGADTLAKLAACLTLSQSASLSLELDVPRLFDPLSADVVATLLPHTHRIISIVNTDGTVMTPKFSSHLDALFAPGSFPSLQSIELRSFDAALLQRLIDGSSFVTSIKNLAPLAQVIGHSNHNAFRELHLEASVDDFLPFLPKFSSLEHLEVRDIHAGLQTRNHDRTATKHDTIKYFGCSGVSSDDPVTALDFLPIFPYLSTLKISMTWMHVYRLLSTFMPSLSDLQIVIHPSTVGTTIPPTILRTSRVKQFTFDNISERERKADHLDLLLRYCEEYMPLLESLQMTLGEDTVQPLDLSTASLGSLLVLKMKLLGTNIHSKAISFISQTIRVLDIDTGRSDCRLGIQCPQLRQLRFARVGFDKEIAFPTPMDAQNLHTLELNFSARDGAWPWDRADLLRNLKKISTKHPTPLLIHLINRPEDYPLLEELSLGGVIEWDWLFLMLERRNFLPTPTISPIISLELEWATPLHLIRPLSHLLRSQYTTRPPNEELSLLFMTRLGQSSARGCWRCLDTLQACDNMAHAPLREELEPAAKNAENTENTENTDINSFPDSRYPLSPSVLLWLKGGKARDEEQRRIVGKIGRTLDCELHRKSKRTRITGFSLPESPGVYTSLASQQFSSLYEKT